MKIIEKAITPNGVEIQLEDWSEHNTAKYPDLYGLEIGAYPVSKNTGKYKFIQAREKFRLSISQNSYSGYTNDMVRADYKALVSGEKQLEDLSKHFWNGEKDMFYLGMPVEYKDY